EGFEASPDEDGVAAGCDRVDQGRVGIAARIEAPRDRRAPVRDETAGGIDRREPAARGAAHGAEESTGVDGLPDGGEREDELVGPRIPAGGLTRRGGEGGQSAGG